MDPEVLVALEALLLALVRSGGRRPLFLELLYPDGRVDRLSLPAPAAPPDRPAARQPTRPPVEQAILDALAGAEGPLPGKAIARRCGRSYTSYFREALSGLVASGEVIRDREAGGYTLPAR
jgi:hypothetical protein